MKRIVLFFLIVSAFFLVHICCERDFSTLPLKTNPREYTWTMDTLAYPGSFQTSMYDIWGSASCNVYVVGHNDQGAGLMFHFDGRSWTDVKLHIVQGGTISGAIDLKAIYGFGPDDIWAVGNRFEKNPTPPPDYTMTSLIIHFDGDQWQEYQVDSGSLLQDVWGISSTNVWAGGIYGTLFHFNGAAWEKVDMPQNHWFLSFAGFSENDVYAISYEFDSLSVSTYYLLHWDGIEWSMEDTFTESATIPDKFGGHLLIIDGQFFSAGDGVFQKTSSGWERTFYEPHLHFRNINGSSVENLFAVGNFGAVYHFNGQDWFPFSQFASDEIHYNASWTNGNEVFIVGTGNGKSYVLHGE